MFRLATQLPLTLPVLHANCPCARINIAPWCSIALKIPQFLLLSPNADKKIVPPDISPYLYKKWSKEKENTTANLFSHRGCEPCYCFGYIDINYKALS